MAAVLGQNAFLGVAPRVVSKVRHVSYSVDEYASFPLNVGEKKKKNSGTSKDAASVSVFRQKAIGVMNVEGPRGRAFVCMSPRARCIELRMPTDAFPLPIDVGFVLQATRASSKRAAVCKVRLVRLPILFTPLAIEACPPVTEEEKRRCCFVVCLARVGRGASSPR